MTNEKILRLEEKLYGTRSYNLEIKSDELILNLRDYAGNFLVTEKNYLLRGVDESLEKRIATLSVNQNTKEIFITYNNCHVAYIIKKFGKPKLIDTLTLIEREKELCFA